MPTVEPAQSAVQPSRSLALFWTLATLTLCLDQASKWAILTLSDFPKGLYPPFGGTELIPGFLNLVYTVNYGAAWGLFQGMGWVLVGLAALVLVGIAVFRKHLELHKPLHQFTFGLITGGIIGNSFDRLYHGHVVDFIDIVLPFYRWPTFNLADSALVVGTLLYAAAQWRQPNTAA